MGPHVSTTAEKGGCEALSDVKPEKRLRLCLFVLGCHSASGSGRQTLLLFPTRVACLLLRLPLLRRRLLRFGCLRQQFREGHADVFRLPRLCYFCLVPPRSCLPSRIRQILDVPVLNAHPAAHFLRQNAERLLARPDYVAWCWQQVGRDLWRSCQIRSKSTGLVKFRRLAQADTFGSPCA